MAKLYLDIFRSFWISNLLLNLRLDHATQVVSFNQNKKNSEHLDIYKR